MTDTPFKVHAYMNAIPPGNKNPEKPKLLQYFIEGVQNAGDKGLIINSNTYEPSDVGVLQGFVHPQSKHVPHLNLRRAVLDGQKEIGRRTIIADSNLFLAYDPKNTKTYLRYSFDGIFPTTGEYCYDSPDPTRWEKLSKDLGIALKPWNFNNGKNILICCQRDGGWSMDGEGVVTWLMKTISELRKYTDRPVVIRFHPGDKRVAGHIKQIAGYRIPKVSWSMADTIQEDFANSYAVINFNSSPAVASVIEGLPTFQLDAGRSQAKGVVHTSLAEIERPQEFAREAWLQKLAQCHWTLEELKTGEAWAHLKKYAIKD